MNIAATDVKNKFGQMLEICQREHVTVEKHGREIAVILNIDEYQRLVGMEERYWGELAQKSMDDGFMDDGEATLWITEKV